MGSYQRGNCLLLQAEKLHFALCWAHGILPDYKMDNVQHNAGVLAIHMKVAYCLL